MASGARLEKHCFSWFCKDMRGGFRHDHRPHGTQVPAALRCGSPYQGEGDQYPICRDTTGSGSFQALKCILAQTPTTTDQAIPSARPSHHSRNGEQRKPLSMSQNLDTVARKVTNAEPEPRPHCTSPDPVSSPDQHSAVISSKLQTHQASLCPPPSMVQASNHTALTPSLHQVT